MVDTASRRDSSAEKLRTYEEAEKLANLHLTKFDDLDFNVFSNQDWVRLHESHSDDVLVHWPDGRQVRGLQRHIEDLSAMFVYAPDTRIKVHPVRIAAGDWTSVIGEMEGTFTKSMPAPDGKSIPPTGKAFKMLMCTVGHWKDGVIDEEYLFGTTKPIWRSSASTSSPSASPPGVWPKPAGICAAVARVTRGAAQPRTTEGPPSVWRW